MKKNNKFILYVIIFIVLAIILYMLFANKKEYFTENDSTKEDTSTEDDSTEETPEKIKEQIEKISKISPEDLDVLFSHLTDKQKNEKSKIIQEGISQLTPEQADKIQPQLDVIKKHFP